MYIKLIGAVEREISLPVVPINGDTIIVNGDCYNVVSREFDTEDDEITCVVNYIGSSENRIRKFMATDPQFCSFYPSSKLQAVKLLKETFNLGLKEAKDYVDSLG